MSALALEIVVVMLLLPAAIVALIYGLEYQRQESKRQRRR